MGEDCAALRLQRFFFARAQPLGFPARVGRGVPRFEGEADFPRFPAGAG